MADRDPDNDRGGLRRPTLPSAASSPRPSAVRGRSSRPSIPGNVRALKSSRRQSLKAITDAATQHAREDTSEHPDGLPEKDQAPKSRTTFVSNTTVKWIELFPIFEPCSSDFMHSITQAIHLAFFAEKGVLVHRHEDVAYILRIHTGAAVVDIDGIAVDKALVDSVFGESMLFATREQHDARVQAVGTTIVEKLSCSAFFATLGNFASEHELFNRLRHQYVVGIGRRLSLKHMPIFQGCGAEFLHRIDSKLMQRTFFEGQMMIEEGTEGHACMLVGFGRLSVTIRGRHVAEVGGGSMIGELAVLGSAQRRTATIHAATLAKVYLLYRPILEATLDEFPEEKERFDLVKKRQAPLSVKDVLKQVDFFKDCRDDFLKLLAERLELRLVMPGEEVVRMNHKVDAIYIIESGVCRCTALGHHLKNIEAGSIFGEMSALGLVEHATATVTAETPCFLQVLHRAVLIAALESCPEELEKFLSIAHTRHGELQEHAHAVAIPDFSEYSIFNACSKDFQSRLVGGVQTRLFLPGESIITEGTVGHECFILMSGEAQAFKGGVVVKDYGPGALFGELALFSLNRGGRREASVQARAMCLVAQLGEGTLWEVLDAFPDEMQVFCATCMHDLQHTVNPRVLRLPFFQDVESGFTNFLLAQLHQRIAMPEELLIKEGTLPDEKLIILNRGILESWQDGIEISLVQPGGHVGGTVVLGIHHAYPFSHRARLMCHIITIFRSTFLEGFRRYPSTKAWLKTAKKHEQREHQEMLRLLRELKQRRRLDEHATRNFGRIFPHMQEALSSGVGKTKLQACFHSWVAFWRRAKTEELVADAMRKASSPRWQTVAAKPAPLPSMAVPAQRPNPRQNMASGTPFSQDGGPSPDSKEAMVPKDILIGTKLPELNNPWEAKVKALLSCSTVDQLYMMNSPRWRHS